MSNKTYDRMKWFALVFLPAANVFIIAVGKIWGLPYYVEVAGTIAALGVFLGAILGISSQEYYKQQKEEEKNDAGKGRKATKKENS